ncbi:ABC transporter ATP-binding protein [Glutamicibacter protophormiae]|uniref:ABC transporter ATP-binding protein n=2 Tax=Kocuria varians TaxID=1272 RepID=UPI002872C1D1|nr:ABC transporter ATP-binding protein [Glutamicibacter protophormiae]
MNLTSAPGATHPLPQTPVLPSAGITVSALVKEYERGGIRVQALAGVDLHLPPGAQVAVMGPSGSGKTTLLHCLAGVLRPTSGSVVVEGQELVGMPERQLSRLRLQRFGFVFQDGQLLPELSNEENIALPRMLAGVNRSAATTRARELLGLLGLAGLGAHRPGQLSGGQAQRVAIARALAAGPQVVFADEPTGALDQATGHEVMGVLTSACRASGATLVLVTHDPGVASWFPAVIEMRDGRILPAAGGVRARPVPPRRAAPGVGTVPGVGAAHGSRDVGSEVDGSHPEGFDTDGSLR